MNEEYKFSTWASGSYFIEERYNFFTSTGTAPTRAIFKEDVNIRIYKCHSCKSRMIINLYKISFASITCPSCGSNDVEREE